MSSPHLTRPPSVDTVARALDSGRWSQNERTRAARTAIASTRESIRSLTLDDIVNLAADQLKAHADSGLRKVINMSGIMLHTGLGRARLAPLDFELLSSHTNLEFDLKTGQRGDRQEHVRGLLREMTGAEDALVVNNCAGALFLTLRALCKGREVLLSRGQMVEIGGSFRIPDIVLESDCHLREIGTTNKTRIEDYSNAVTDATGAILRCHPSNFKIVGFTSEPTAEEISQLVKNRNLLMIDDIGHGNLLDLASLGLPPERTLRQAVTDGADIVLASADKLLGGPQAGLILGRSELIQTISRHPLARALRIDKLSLTALVTTLRLIQTGSIHRLPLYRYATRSIERVKSDAKRLSAAFPSESVVSESVTLIGGGSLPDQGLRTFRAGLMSPKPDSLLAKLRNFPTPIIGRIEAETVWLDPRTAEPDEVRATCAYLKTLL